MFELYLGHIEVRHQGHVLHRIPFDHKDRQVIVPGALTAPHGQAWEVIMEVINPETAQKIRNSAGLIATNGSTVTVVLPDPMFRIAADSLNSWGNDVIWRAWDQPVHAESEAIRVPYDDDDDLDWNYWEDDYSDDDDLA